MQWVITDPASVRRVAMVRVTQASGRHTNHVCNKNQLRGFRNIKILSRRWAMYIGFIRHETWIHLCMAKAQRDGYNFHYAKYLLMKGGHNANTKAT